jgi:enoyl-CoA hydratase/carnithine racemase
MTEQQPVLVSQRGPVTVIQLKRASVRNAINAATAHEFQVGKGRKGTSTS